MSQPDLFADTQDQPPHSKKQACPCLCCVQRRDRVSSWKRRLPRRKKPKPIYSDPRWWPLADGNAKLRVKTLGRALSKMGRKKGQHSGQLTPADLDVLYMLISYPRSRSHRPGWSWTRRPCRG
jgi:hypothetical protein